MPSREEMELLLKDSITPGLRSIARELKALNQAAKESETDSAGHVERFGKSVGGVEASSNAALKGMTAMGSYIIGFGKSILGIGGTIETVKKLGEGLTEFADNRAKLSDFSTDTKFASRDILQMRQAMNLMGVETDQANTYISRLGGKLQELRAFREGSTLFQDLAKMQGGGVQFGRQLLGDVKQDDYKKAVDDILEFYKQQGPEAQFYLSQILGIPQSVLQSLDEYKRKVTEVFEGNEEAAAKAVENMARLRHRLSDEWDRFADHAVESLNKVMEAADKDTQGKHWISDFFIQGWDAFTAKLEQDKKDIIDITNMISKGKEKLSQEVNEGVVAKLERFLKGEGGPTEAKKALADAVGKMIDAKQTGPAEANSALADAVGKVLDAKQTGPAEAKAGIQGAFGKFGFGVKEEEQLQRDNNKLLQDIRDLLLLAEGKGGGGGGGMGLPGMGIRRPGGAAQAGGGGFRPVRGPRDAAGGKYTEGESQPGSEHPGVIDRKRFAEEMEKNPALKEKMLGIMAGEQGANPRGTQAIAESVMNRAAMLGNKLSYEARTTGEGGYYAGYKPAALQNPAWRKVLEESLSKALAGSNVSNYATDNASDAPGNPLASREEGSGAFRRQELIHGEHFLSPGNRDSGRGRNRANYEKWRAKVDAEQQNNVFNKGTAAVKIDFGVPANSGKQNEKPTDGGVFKELKIGREGQSPKSGGDPKDSYSRWYFQ